MKENKNILNQLKKSDKPVLPKDFFENFSSNITDNVNGYSILKQLKKTEKPLVNDAFFNEFPDRITAEVTSNKKTRVIPLSYIYTIISVAAIFAVVFTIYNSNSTTQTNLADETFKDSINSNSINIVSNEIKPKLIPSNTEKPQSIIDEVLFFSDTENLMEEDVIFLQFEAEMDDFYYDL